IGFEDENYDESQYQEMVSDHLKTDHSAFKCTDKNIAEILLDVIWHTEKPLLRTAPAPLYLLSKLVSDSGYKVVLTGEGADEFFCGYNIFKETKVRCFNAQQPESTLRPRLFERLYPYLDTKKDRNNRFWGSFFKKGLLDTHDPFYSHRIRWQNNAFIVQFLSDDAINQIDDYDPVQELSNRLQSDLENLSPISRAQFLEVYIFLGNYLLSSQGDRMLMSHAVEGRFPFLDRKVIEFANRLSPTLKLKGLKEKWILKKAFTDALPSAVVNRDKQPYRAPIKNLFSSNKEMVGDFVSTSRISQDGIFSHEKVNLLKRKIGLHPDRVSPREEMAWTAILTTEMLNSLFLNRASTQLQDHKEQWFVMDHRTNIKARSFELSYSK
ncbi:MAG: asparagine synthetase B family protein, partial [bacterium]